jgi:hypothetical protein
MDTYPVRVVARLDRPGRWLWLVKWLLLIPHYLVLAVLWVAFVALTLVAYVAVLFTGRYPAGIFDFNVGVLRWTWRVGYYGYSALGTDRYPPFTLADVPDYPARLVLDGPPRAPRWLPLVAWLLALPHLIIIGLLTGSGWSIATADGRVSYSAGVLGILVLVAGIALLFTGRYPAGLFDFVVGMDRWVVRTVAYVALLTDRYPPFRLDLGGDEPETVPPGPKTSVRSGGSPSASVVAGGAGAHAPLRRRSPTGSAGRVAAIVAGAMVLVAGVGAVAGGVVALGVNASRNAAGYVVSDPIDVSTPTAAVTVEGFEIHPAHIFDRDVTGLGRVRVEVSATAVPLFIGVARESDVDAWLAGTRHDEVTGIHDDGSGVTLRRSVGTVRPVSPPAGEEFWLAYTSGTGNLRLDWRPGAGRFAVVLANADGSTGLTATVTAGAKVPALGVLGAGLLSGGLVGILAGALLLYLGAVGRTGRPPRPGPPPPQRPAPPIPPAPPQATLDGPRTASMAR